MNITSKNYFSTVKKFDLKSLPEILFLSHDFIAKETNNGKDWSAFGKDAGFTRMAKLVFIKLEEFMNSNKKVKPIDGLEGVKPKSKKQNPYADIKTEVYFLEWVLEFHNTIADKKKLGIFIDELQKAIKEKRITKKSPVAKEIRAIETASLSAFNNIRNVKDFMLKPSTIKNFKSIIEKHKNSLEDIDENLAQAKKKSVPLEGITKPEENIMSSVDFSNLQFDTIGFKDKWLNLIGDPSPGFTAMVFGMPKMGKSYLCVDFANYLSLNHGKVLYVSKEEYMSPTLAIKLKDKNVANDNLDITGSIPDDLSAYDFIFLDSVTSLKLSPDDLKGLKEKNPNASFVYVFQVTKDGKARGANEHTHNVDIVIEVPEKGKAVQYGRFNQGGKMDIFSNDEYAENKEDTQAINDLDVSENKSTLAGIKKSEMKEKNKIKMVADISDPNTKKALKMIWDLMDAKQRKRLLDTKGYSDKFVDWSFDDLTPAIQQMLMTPNARLEHKIKSAKSKDWTEPEGLNASDWESLKTIKKYCDEGKFKEAMEYATQSCDTVIREEIPGEIWIKMGGKLTASGMEKLKGGSSNYDERSDADNPKFIFTMTSTLLLVEALKGGFNLNYLVRKELANRGLNNDGKWVGFPEAAKIHKIKE